MKPPVFILGTQRSGTTLLFQILNTHPNLYVVNEFWDLYRLLENGVRDAAGLEELLRARLDLPAYRIESGVPPERVFAHVASAFQQKAKLHGKDRWGLKDPHITYHAERFHAAYPGSRFLIALRDPRGVVASYLEQKMNVANVMCGALLWKREIELQQELIRRHPADCLLLKYEDLLQDPEPELRRICAFLQEEFTADLLEYHRSRPAIRLHAGNVNITQPLQTDFAEKWRRSLSARQIGIIEGLCADPMASFGYRPIARNVRLSALERAFHRAHQEVVTTYWWQQRTRWAGVRRRIRRALGMGMGIGK